MGLYGTHWSIDGVRAAFVMRGIRNGRYRIVFEREYAELPQIESINWAQPNIEHTNSSCPNELGLPKGYGFEVESITYDSTSRSYTVEVRVADQYLGDVTEYQARIDALQADADEKAATIAEKEATIEALEAAGTAEAVKADLQAAYTEGVESNG